MQRLPLLKLYFVLLGLLFVVACSREGEDAQPANAPKQTVKLPGGEIEFTWDELSKQWKAKYHLPGWAGFHCENSRPDLADGEAFLIIDGESSHTPISEQQIQALRWLVSHSDTQQSHVVKAIIERYASLRVEMKPHFHADQYLMIFPDATTSDAMRKLISLTSVKIYDETKNGIPYLGYDLEAHWDVEHGIQALMNGDRVIAAGSDALNPAYIQADGGK